MKRVSVLLLACAALLAAEVEPGRHRKIPCEGTAYTYDLYVPASYAEETERRFPCLYLSSPTSNPGTFDLHRWAEEHGVVIVAINDSKNGLSWEKIEEIQEAVLAAVKASVRTHPHLNFAAGISGGARCSFFLADRRSEEFAGVLSQCMSGTPDAAHIGCAWIHGAKDATIGVGGVWSSYERMKGAGRPCHIEVNRSRKHTPGSRGEKEAAMTYLLWAARLTHPGLSKEERKANYHAFDAAMEACIAIEAPAERIERAEFLASLPNARRCPNHDAMVEAWGEACWARIEAAEGNPEKYELLMDLAASPLVRGITRETKRACAKLRAELAKDDEAVAHLDAVQRFRKFFEMEKRVGLDTAGIAEVRTGFAKLAEDHPDHPLGISAGKNAKRLEKY